MICVTAEDFVIYADGPTVSRRVVVKGWKDWSPQTFDAFVIRKKLRI
jgi:hypothetical protein